MAQMNAPFAYRFIVMTSSRASLVLGTILVVASLVLSGFTRAIWQLVMTQAVVCAALSSIIRANMALTPDGPSCSALAPASSSYPRP